MYSVFDIIIIISVLLTVVYNAYFILMYVVRYIYACVNIIIQMCR